jgi:hypothetical protein
MSWRIAVQTLPGPSLDLVFTNRSLVDNISGQNLITFTRASSATYVDSNRLIRTAAVNEPRFDHNPATGESLGLLIEEQRTNLLLYSEQFDNAGWPKFSANITANATTAPDGTTTADKFASTSGAALIALQQASSALSNGGRYTRSVFAKASEISSFTLQIGNTTTGTDFVQVNLLTGTATNGAVVTALPNEWFRISYSYIQSGTLSDFYFTLPANTISGNGIFIWGAQLEQGAFPTSYIPTTTAAVTRAADMASITGANFSSWYNYAQGTIYAESRPISLTSNGHNTAGISDGSSDNAFYIQQFTNSGIFYYNRSGSSELVALSAGVVPTSNTNYRSAFAYQVNDYAASFGGGTIKTDALGILPSNVNRLVFGNLFAGSSQGLTGTVKKLTYWPTRLPNSTLQRLTQ